MDAIAHLIDLILNVDQYLAEFITQYGYWVYALLFAIIFVETGLVVMPFLPGDSLLFVVGMFAGSGLLDWYIALPVLSAAAILGDQLNYSIGRYIGPKAFAWENSKWFNKSAFDKAHEFYEKRGGVTIILARFFPFLRTFAPFVGGVAQMNRSTFTAYNIVGGILWVWSVGLAGYFLGHIPWVKEHLEKIIWGMILIPGVLVLLGSLRNKKPA